MYTPSTIKQLEKNHKTKKVYDSVSCDGSLTNSGSSLLNTKHYFLLDYRFAANTDTRHYQAFHSGGAGNGEPRIMLSCALDGPLIILLQICGQDRIVKILQKFPLQIKLVHKIKKTVFRRIIIALLRGLFYLVFPDICSTSQLCDAI